MTAHKLQVAREMYDSGQYTVAAIAVISAGGLLEVGEQSPR
jgi:hypothetical protein